MIGSETQEVIDCEVTDALVIASYCSMNGSKVTLYEVKRELA